jgi:hypothetical protein
MVDEMNTLESELIALIQKDAPLRDIAYWAFTRGVNIGFSMPEADNNPGDIFVNEMLAKPYRK